MKYLILVIPAIMISLTSCGTLISTDSRFQTGSSGKGKETNEIKKNDTLNLKEDFDITPFMTKIDLIDSIPEANQSKNNKLDIWYDYDTVPSSSILKKQQRQSAGYRVLILTTDNLEEANSIKSEIYFKTDQKPVYITFEPPFYKIKAGDFLYQTEASEFGFKLNQMGYTETKVIRDTINIFQ
jgi:hypothetical protein